MCVRERHRERHTQTHRDRERERLEGGERESGCGDGGDKTLEIKYVSVLFKLVCVVRFHMTHLQSQLLLF